MIISKKYFKLIFYNLKLFYSFFLKCITPLLIQISPETLSWLTHFNSSLRRLPSLKDRIIIKQNPLDEFIFYTENENIFEEVNVVMRGEYSEKLNTKIPTFFINVNKAQTNIPNRYYVSSDRLKFKAMMGKAEREEDECLNYADPEKKFHYFIAISPLVVSFELHKPHLDKKNYLKRIHDLKKSLGFDVDYKLSVCCHKFNGFNVQIGSGIIAVISLLRLSKKVNVYGWDSFLTSSLPNIYFWQTLKLWSPFKDHQPVSRFAANILNWIYAHRLLNHFPPERLVVHGKMTQVARLKWIEDNLYKMIYKLKN